MFISFNTINSTDPKLKYRFGLLAMLVLSLGLTLSFIQPGIIFTDGGIFSSVAYKDIHGGKLYLDAWENKPPGIFYLIELFMLIIPDPVYAIFILVILALNALGSLIYTYIFNRLNSLSASLMLTTVSYCILFYKLNLHDGLYTEIYGTICIVAALVCFQRSEIQKKDWYLNLSFGLLGLSFWFKEPFILLSLAGFWYIYIYSDRQIRWWRSAIFFLIPSVFFLLLLLASGSLPAFIDTLLYNFKYSRAEAQISLKVKINELYDRLFKYLVPLMLMILFWIFRSLSNKKNSRKVFASFILLLSSISFVFISPYNFGHYYIPFYVFIILFFSDAYAWDYEINSAFKIPFIILGLYCLSDLEKKFDPHLNYCIQPYKEDRIIETLRKEKNKTLFVDCVERADIYIKAQKVPPTYVPVALPVHFQADSVGLKNRERIYGEIENKKPDYLITNFTASYFSWFMPNSPYYENNYFKVDSVKPSEETIIILWKRKPDKY